MVDEEAHDGLGNVVLEVLAHYQEVRADESFCRGKVGGWKEEGWVEGRKNECNENGGWNEERMDGMKEEWVE